MRAPNDSQRLLQRIGAMRDDRLRRRLRLGIDPVCGRRHQVQGCFGHAGIPLQDASALERDLTATEGKLSPQHVAMFSRFEGMLMMDGSGNHPLVDHAAHAKQKSISPATAPLLGPPLCVEPRLDARQIGHPLDKRRRSVPRDEDRSRYLAAPLRIDFVAPPNRGALTAPTCMALPCRWRSRPQHQTRT
jgi:hypothetical protein